MRGACFLVVALLLPNITAARTKPVLTARIAFWDSEAMRAAATTGLLRGIRIAFVNDETAVVAAVFSDSVNSTPGTHSAAVLVTVDVSSGAAIHTKSWSIVRGESAVSYGPFLAAGENRILFSTGQKLYRLSSALDIVAERDLPTNPRIVDGHLGHDRWDVQFDRYADRCLLRRFIASGGYENHWIARDTLADISVEEKPVNTFGPMVLVAGKVIYNGLREQYEVVLIEENGDSRRLCKECTGFVAATVGGKVLLAGNQVISVVTPSGEIKHVQKTTFAPAISGAQYADRIAMSKGRISGDGRKSKTEISVYDLGKKQPIWRFAWSEGPTNVEFGGSTFLTPQLALSPSGKHLAVVGADVKIFKLPE
jgi:hypothetical protein